MAATAVVPQIQQGLFSPNSATLNQTFFNAAFAGRISANPVYKETYWCKIIGEMGFGTFLDEYTGFDTFGFSSFSNVEYNPYYDQVKVSSAGATVPAYPSTVAIPVDVAASQFYATYILPQVGQTLVLPPYGALVLVTAVTPNGSSPTVTVRHLSTTGTEIVLAAGAELKVLTGKYLADCACPTGPFRVMDIPIVQALAMKAIGETSGEICGKALLERQNLKLPFYSETGEVEQELWFNEPLAKMYRDFEKAKTYLRLLDPDWGLIPTLVARGGVFTTDSPSEMDIDDIYVWGSALKEAGVSCTEYAVFCGRDLFVMFQKLLNKEGVDKVLYSIFDQMDDCKWLNLNWCGLKVGGLTLHVFEEDWMGNGLALGAAGFNFRKAGIMVPLCNRSTNIKESEMANGKPSNKMLTTTYLKDNMGRVWDNIQDGNGLYGPRNTYGVLCDKQEWGVKSEFAQTVHCPQAWGLINFL